MSKLFNTFPNTIFFALALMSAAASAAQPPVTLASLPSVKLTRPAPVAPGTTFVLQGTAQASAGLASAEAYIDNRPLFSRAISGNALDIGSLGISVPVTAKSQTIRFLVKDRNGRVFQDGFQLDALLPQSPQATGDAMIAFNPPNARAGALALISGSVGTSRGLQQVNLTLTFRGTIIGAEKRVVSGTTVQLESLNWRPNLPGAGAYTLTIEVVDRNLAKTTRTFTFNVAN